MTNIDDAKNLARKTATVVRKRAFDNNPNAGNHLSDVIMAARGELGLSDRQKTISIFWPMGNEIDTRPLIQSLSEAGHRTALPVVAAKAAPLIFRVWGPGDQLVDGGFGTSIPDSDALEVLPEILFVPLLSFDDAGYRLGYGGGFYDRTLQKLRMHVSADAVGVAFSAQRVDTVIRGPHDQLLDWMATELGFQRVSALADTSGDEGKL
jgi:5-formyltetrahydrofolate cyclo-ligase